MNVLLVIIALLGCGLMAGVFYAFSAFVLGALSSMAPAEGLRAMQAINVAAVRPAFLSGFLGTAALCAVVAVFAARNLSHPAAVWMLAGAALYLLGGILVTIVGNVPLNDALAKVNSTLPESAAVWSDYVRKWGMWNHVRTLACSGAVIAFAVAAFRTD